MKPGDRIFVAGHRGLVGSALIRGLSAAGLADGLLTIPRADLDLRDQAAVDRWFDTHRPEYVFMAAGTVGGIHANAARPAEFIYDNLMMHATVVHAAYRVRVKKLLYLGSACIYPRESAQPIAEEALLSGPLEPTNEPYAVAKIAGMQLCQAYRRQYGCDFISVMPTNLYGPGDNFDLTSSHVLPAIIRKCHDAKLAGRDDIAIWGTGRARREFLHVDDLADACVFLMRAYSEASHINVGTGDEISIADVAALVRDLVHPGARLVFDSSKPDGMPRRRLDVTKVHALGWCHRIPLAEGLRSTYAWYCAERRET